MEFYAQQLKRQYALLRHEGFWTQCHAQNVQEQKPVSRELIYGEEKVISWAKENNGKGNIFLGRNPRKQDGSVSHCTTLSLDIDPIYDKQLGTTEDQLQYAIQAGNTLLREFKWGTLSISGNGALLLFPTEDIDLDSAKRYGQILEKRARALLEREINENKIVVDSTFNPAGLVKAMGAISTKGDQARWRYARFIECGNRIKPVSSVSFLEWIKRSASTSTSSQMRLPEVKRGELDRSASDMALAARFKIQGFTAENALAAMAEYSFRPERTDDHQRIIQKVYYGTGPSLVSGGAVREGVRTESISLVTPESGIDEYINRASSGVPELPTGFKSIDDATFGLIRGSIFTVAARTNCGKTTFSLGVALHICRQGKRVLFMSTETVFQEVWDRYIACATGIPAFTLQHGGNLNGSTKSYQDFMEEFKKHQLHVYDGSRPSLPILRTAIEKAQPDVLVFDYFQHVSARETRELEEFVMSVKDLAKETNVAVLMCAQLHDRYDFKTGKMVPPTLQDMKNSKVLNDESRVVLLLDWNRDDVQGDGPAAVKGILAKNKGLRTDCILKLDRRVPRFVEDSE